MHAKGWGNVSARGATGSGSGNGSAWNWNTFLLTSPLAACRYEGLPDGWWVGAEESRRRAGQAGGWPTGKRSGPQKRGN